MRKCEADRGLSTAHWLTIAAHGCRIWLAEHPRVKVPAVDCVGGVIFFRLCPSAAGQTACNLPCITYSFLANQAYRAVGSSAAAPSDTGHGSRR